MKAIVFSLAMILGSLAGAATQKTHACAGNDHGDVSLVDVMVVAETGQKQLKVAGSKGPIRQFVITRETQGAPSLLEGWEVDVKSGKTTGARVALQVPADLKTQGDLKIDDQIKKIRCSRVAK